MYLICFNRRGSKKKLNYSIVVVYKKSSHQFIIETLGFFNPDAFFLKKLENDKSKCVVLDSKRLNFWLVQGAVITTRLKNLLVKVNFF